MASVIIDIQSVHWDDQNPNWSNAPVHVQYHILVLVTNGRLRYSLNCTSLFPEKADIVYIPAGTLRAASNAPDLLHQKYAVIFQADESVHERLPFLTQHRNQIIKCSNFEYLKQRYSTLYQHWAEKQPYYEILASGIFLEILSYVQRDVTTRHISPVKVRLSDRLKEYIVQHYRTAIKLEELAAIIDRSPNYVIALFKETTGMTPLEFMLQLRISKAHELLHHTRMTHGEIAEYLGFYDSSYFFRVFKRQMGYPPSAVRNQPLA
ncbi:helix-turn-helix domain-containing protein [Paenibacillus cremeus]|uniref:Helix-turn-helix transcriptional regulator n=1 Tax=Paenibacillus cremeus TaxID=2163881 RepID=A0A559KGQ7_9BACL|nr:AraC family transcriptional regulator [Paenibacillus cremeus]TVY11309.1 helix-turn-helix transcriptional regulator [Paenibacillus cremeus]